MKLRSKRKPVADMNVVPYIDVMLVLLIIFMVTAPMLVQGVSVDIPKVDSAPITVDERKQHLIIALTKEGQALIEPATKSRLRSMTKVLRPTLAVFCRPILACKFYCVPTEQCPMDGLWRSCPVFRLPVWIQSV